jgi:zinc protease
MRNTVHVAAGDAPPKRYTLSNGATLVVQARGTAPLVSTAVTFRGGRTQETAANAGITRLMLGTLRRGTRSRTGPVIDRELDFHGAQLAPIVADDGFGFQLEALTTQYEQALDLLADVLLHPAFAERGLALEKSVQAAAIRRQMDSSSERPLQLFRAAMYPGHPYGLPELGTEASLGSLDRAAVQGWWQGAVAADRATILVVGNIDAEDARRVVEAKLAALPRTGAALRPLPPAPKPTRVVESVEQRDRKQTSMVVAFPAVPLAHPDWAALRLLQSVTSGLSGTFFAELRGRQSLAYTVGARPVAFAQQGSFAGYLACEASKEAAARTGLVGEIHRLAGDGVQAADLARAQSYFSGSTRIARESNSALAREYATNVIADLPLDRVDRLLVEVPRLTVDQMRVVARRYLAGEDYVYAAVRGGGARISATSPTSRP